MESLIYIANGMYVASYFTSDILRLRLLTVAAASCLATYFYALAEPLWTIIGWNVFFIALNLFQIGRVLRSRRRARRRRAAARPAPATAGLAMPSRTGPREASQRRFAPDHGAA